MTAPDDASLARGLEALARGPLAAWLPAQRWFGAKGRAVTRVALADAVSLCLAPGVALGLFDVTLAPDNSVERYAIPLSLEVGVAGDDALGTVTLADGRRLLARDASDRREVVSSLLGLSLQACPCPTALGGHVGGRAEGFARAAGVRRLGAEQSNTSYVLGLHLVVKLFRRLQPGVQPDVEVPEFLTRVAFPNTPPLVGVVEYRGPDDGDATALAVAQQFVANRGDAWAATLAALRGTLATGEDVTRAAAPMRRLGEVTGAMHAALASDADDPAFAPEPVDDAYRRGLAAGVAARMGELAALVPRVSSAWPEPLRLAGAALVARADAVTAAVADAAGALSDDVARIRVHGDYHLGQVLVTDGDFMVIDFEGEPARPLAERRAKSCALRDVAGMLRSFDYAAATLAHELHAPEARARADAWEAEARRVFLDGWRRGAAGARAAITPAGDGFERALALFELDKALYEVSYEINNRPDWVAIPLAGVARALAAMGVAVQ